MSSAAADDDDALEETAGLRHELRAMKKRMRELDKRLQSLEDFCSRHDATLLQLKEGLDKQALQAAREQNLALRRKVPIRFFSQTHQQTQYQQQQAAPPDDSDDSESSDRGKNILRGTLPQPLLSVFPGGLPRPGVFKNSTLK